MTIKQPFVSIILPTYNGKHERLSQAIDSVIDQTYINRELIIINDASANDVENAILEYVQKDKRIRYYKNEKNLKLPKSLNK
jgi:glycosyltransferase involved in cell wall biosynthesis